MPLSCCFADVEMHALQPSEPGPKAPDSRHWVPLTHLKMQPGLGLKPLLLGPGIEHAGEATAMALFFAYELQIWVLLFPGI